MSDSQPAETPAKPDNGKAPWRKLETIVDVRRALGTVVKRVYDGKLSPDKGSVCISGLKALGGLIYDADIERRLREVEERLRGTTS